MTQVTQTEVWIAAMARAAAHYGQVVDTQSVRQQMRWYEQQPIARQLEQISHLMGLSISLRHREKLRWRNQILPVLAETDDGGVIVIESLNDEGIATYWLNDGGDLQREAELTELIKHSQGIIVLVGIAERGRDTRIDDFVKPYRKHWFWQHFRGAKRQIGEISLASVVGNVLALAGILFSMQVYDRVIPAQSIPTLWVLFFGVLLAAALEYAIRLSRTVVSDLMGKSIDLNVSGMLFARALAIKNEARPKSTGSFISQLREIDQVRELLTSTTVGAAADMPFVLLFLGIMAMIGGPLVFIPMLAIPLIVIPGLMLQWPMAKLAKEGMRESALRNAVLVESIEGIEDIKALQAEPYFQRQWEQTHEVSASIGMKQRVWGARLSGWASTVQQLTYAGMLVFGCYLVMAGDITTGTLVACSLLSSRTIAPLMQLTMVFSRWQHAKTAMTGLDDILQKPLDRPEDGKMAHCPILQGHFQLHNVQYSYDPEKGDTALQVGKLEIKPGEKVALLGKVGAGKSTLLKLLANQATATRGKVIIDGVDISQIDPADVRRQLGFLSQESRLFFGSLRQNLMLGNPHATEQELLQALRISGALSLIQQDAASLDRLIHEGGRGLSGGQRQMILLSRMLLRNPQIVLLDEPTASMDEQLESHVIHQLSSWLTGRTLVLVTHRPALLKLVDRVVVMDGGRIVADGPRDQILKAISKPAQSVA
ncbi:ATP-binding protein [Pectobacterium actinidiae]|uniref:ATP-binding protein n=1 Tax=Pectobacterium actinidiae TaxID=1507808 RepID=A0A1V2QYR8_9GAMM|nr:type I secretion system permease/ATPase [Pectobacterium actinidiae]KHN90818.1 putative type I secretion protein, ATP-binding protein [Pectobacterium actinidiae]ONK01514.1 ATP-binding protein [Pectobacterium actinidiae]ONK01995.1 ATP-binding protein [Pectobacterium actinidiae]GLW36661.1 ABC transporter ATP-binding protein [Pectobacterium carotovorum subsp. carotovorum]